MTISELYDKKAVEEFHKSNLDIHHYYEQGRYLGSGYVRKDGKPLTDRDIYLIGEACKALNNGRNYFPPQSFRKEINGNA